MSVMEIARDIDSVRKAVAAARSAGRRIACVPTMGALHAGHLSLVQAAKRDGGFLVVTIFVNPTQFGPNEEFNRYPRDHAGDVRKCEQEGVDLVFLPPTRAMYRAGAVTQVRVARLTETLCGPGRPGHFDSVTTVVAKLFNIVQPDAAYFGQKDAQQLAVIRRMVRDLDWPIEIVGCPIVREPDGLAMSSRNECLSDAEREQANSLYRALRTAQERLQGGERDPAIVIEAMRRVIENAGPTRIDYLALVDPETMQPVERVSGPVLAALAVNVGRTRLIDNLLVDPQAHSS